MIPSASVRKSEALASFHNEESCSFVCGQNAVHEYLGSQFWDSFIPDELNLRERELSRSACLTYNNIVGVIIPRITFVTQAGPKPLHDS